MTATTLRQLTPIHPASKVFPPLLTSHLSGGSGVAGPSTALVPADPSTVGSQTGTTQLGQLWAKLETMQHQLDALGRTISEGFRHQAQQRSDMQATFGQGNLGSETHPWRINPNLIDSSPTQRTSNTIRITVKVLLMEATEVRAPTGTIGEEADQPPVTAKNVQVPLTRPYSVQSASPSQSDRSYSPSTRFQYHEQAEPEPFRYIAPDYGGKRYESFSPRESPGASRSPSPASQRSRQETSKLYYQEEQDGYTDWVSRSNSPYTRQHYDREVGFEDSRPPDSTTYDHYHQPGRGSRY